VVAVLFFVCRCCVCKSCPWCITAPGALLFGVNDVPKAGFTLSERRMSKLWLSIVFVLLLAACAVGYVGNGKVTAEMTALIDGLVKAVDTTVQITSEMVALITQDGDSFDISGKQIAAMQKEMYTVSNMTHGAKGNVYEAEAFRYVTLNLALISTMGLVLIGLIGSLCSLSYLAFYMCLLAWVAAVIMWMCFGLHLGMAVFLDDTCSKFDDYLLGDTKNIEGLDHLIKCPDSPIFSTMFESVYTATDVLRKGVNDQTQGLPSIGITTIPQMKYVNPNGARLYPLHVEAYSSFDKKCNSTDVQLQAKRQTGSASTKAKISDLEYSVGRMENGSLLNLRISFISTCAVFRMFVRNMYREMCGDMMTGFRYVYACFGALGILMIATVIIGSKMANRLDSDNWEENIGKSADASEDPENQAKGLLEDQDLPADIEANPIESSESDSTQREEAPTAITSGTASSIAETESSSLGQAETESTSAAPESNSGAADENRV